MIKTNKFSEIILDEGEIFNQVMCGVPVNQLTGAIVYPPVDLETAALILTDVPSFITYDEYAEDKLSIQEFDHRNQSEWFMPDKYKQLDIAKYVLDLCKTDAELQR